MWFIEIFCCQIGCSSFDAPVVQMPRSVRLVRHADLLDPIASIPHSWPSPQTTIRHKCEVKRGEYWKDTGQTVIKAIGDLKMASHDDWGREQCRLLGIIHRYTKTSKCEWYRGGQDWRRHCLLNRPDIWSPRFYSLLLPAGGRWRWAGMEKKGFQHCVDINTKQHLILDRPLFIAGVSSAADKTWDIMLILLYESRKQNDNSTMNFNYQLLSLNYFLFCFLS